jgi:hypothetical protein
MSELISSKGPGDGGELDESADEDAGADDVHQGAFAEAEGDGSDDDGCQDREVEQGGRGGGDGKVAPNVEDAADDGDEADEQHVGQDDGGEGPRGVGGESLAEEEYDLDGGDKQGHDDGQPGEQGADESPRLELTAVGEGAGEDGDHGGGEGPLAEKAAGEVGEHEGDAEGGEEAAGAEEVAEGDLANEAEDPREKSAYGDDAGGADQAARTGHAGHDRPAGARGQSESVRDGAERGDAAVASGERLGPQRDRPAGAVCG